MKRFFSLFLALVLIAGLGLNMAMPTYASESSSDSELRLKYGGYTPNDENLYLKYAEDGYAEITVQIAKYNIWSGYTKVRIGNAEFNADVDTTLKKNSKYESIITFSFERSSGSKKTHSFLGVHGDKDDLDGGKGTVKIVMKGKYKGWSVPAKEFKVGASVNASADMVIAPNTSGDVRYDLVEELSVSTTVVPDSSTTASVSITSKVTYDTETYALRLYEMYENERGSINKEVDEELSWFDELFGVRPSRYVGYSGNYMVVNKYKTPDIYATISISTPGEKPGQVRCGERATIRFSVRNDGDIPILVDVDWLFVIDNYSSHTSYGCWSMGEVYLEPGETKTFTHERYIMSDDIRLGGWPGTTLGWDEFRFRITGTEHEVPVKNTIKKVVYRFLW